MYPFLIRRLLRPPAAPTPLRQLATDHLLLQNLLPKSPPNDPLHRQALAEWFVYLVRAILAPTAPTGEELQILCQSARSVVRCGVAPIDINPNELAVRLGKSRSCFLVRLVCDALKEGLFRFSGDPSEELLPVALALRNAPFLRAQAQILVALLQQLIHPRE